jgi:cytochrome P450
VELNVRLPRPPGVCEVAVRGIGLELWDEDSGALVEKRVPSWGPQEETAWGVEETVHAFGGYEDCRRALGADALVSQIDNGNLKQSESNLLFADGENHVRLRGIISRALPSWRVTAASTDRFIGELMERLPSAGRIDIVNDFAVPIAEDTSCSILGLPDEERNRLGLLLGTMTAQFDPGSAAEDLESSRVAGQALLSRLRSIISQKSYSSGSALDHLDQARSTGELTVRELLATVVMLAHASFQNSVNLLSFAAIETMTNPRAREAITSSEASLQRAGVEELLRLGSPARFLIRRATATIGFGTTVVAPEDIVIPCVGMANRDPAVFTAPDEFDPKRVRTTHLAFGAGPHACLGAATARAETLSAMRALAGKYRTLTVDSVTWGRNAVMYGPASLLVDVA